MEVPGKRRRGRPKQRWLDNIKNDLSERELSGEEAQDRVQWRRLVRNIDPHIKVGKDAEEDPDSIRLTYGTLPYTTLTVVISFMRVRCHTTYHTPYRA